MLEEIAGIDMTIPIVFGLGFVILSILSGGASSTEREPILVKKGLEEKELFCECCYEYTKYRISPEGVVKSSYWNEEKKTLTCSHCEAEYKFGKESFNAFAERRDNELKECIEKRDKDLERYYQNKEK